MNVCRTWHRELVREIWTPVIIPASYRLSKRYGADPSRSESLTISAADLSDTPTLRLSA